MDTEMLLTHTCESTFQEEMKMYHLMPFSMPHLCLCWQSDVRNTHNGKEGYGNGQTSRS